MKQPKVSAEWRFWMHCYQGQLDADNVEQAAEMWSWMAEHKQQEMEQGDEKSLA